MWLFWCHHRAVVSRLFCRMQCPWCCLDRHFNTKQTKPKPDHTSFGFPPHLKQTRVCPSALDRDAIDLRGGPGHITHTVHTCPSDICYWCGRRHAQLRDITSSKHWSRLLPLAAGCFGKLDMLQTDPNQNQMVCGAVFSVSCYYTTKIKSLKLINIFT